MAQRNELLGYADPLVVRPGETVKIMVTTEAEHFDAEIVRLVHGDTNPNGPGFKSDRLDSTANGSYPGRHQETHIGSYAQVDVEATFGESSGGVSIQAWIWPTTPGHDRSQGIVTRWAEDSGYGLFVEGGAVSLKIGDATISTAAGLVSERWHFVAGTYDAATGDATVQWRLLEFADARDTASGVTQADASGSGLPFLIAAGGQLDIDKPAPLDCFNGKIEHPRVFSRALRAEEIDALASDSDPLAIDGLIAAWDFAASAPHTDELVDTGPAALNGSVVNYPMRGLTGHLWNGTVFRRSEGPGQYGAVHFHDDDFDDSRWECDFEFEVPHDLRSGFYAAHLEGAGEHDYVPFFVSPPPGVSNSDIAYLAPTNTYLAYGNERLLTSSGGVDFSGLTNIPITLDPLDEYLGEHREYGGSIYDRHTDGSGIAYSTTRRPIISMRPTQRHWVTGCPRGFGFDLYMIDWLEQKLHDYDVITDEDIHFQGLDRLSGYKVVITASHPEYWSGQMLDALEGYLAQGGRLMYVGGNGFYWATAFDPERPHIIEVRRGIAGSRAWESHPGEQEMASTGEHGGIWRHLGRPPNALVGNGFAGQGWDLDTPGFRRLPDSFDPRAAFIFEGIGDDEEIGEFGLVMNGAAGDELDRADHALGTPAHALTVASSANMHSDYYLVCHEDMLVNQHQTHGTDNPNLRADMMFFETDNGGAVFSIGSINWLGSLSHNNYDNNVSRITDNVLREFTK
jgi:N,N-dimethylformamidase